MAKQGSYDFKFGGHKKETWRSIREILDDAVQLGAGGVAIDGADGAKKKKGVR